MAILTGSVRTEEKTAADRLFDFIDGERLRRVNAYPKSARRVEKLNEC